MADTQTEGETTTTAPKRTRKPRAAAAETAAPAKASKPRAAKADAAVKPATRTKAATAAKPAAKRTSRKTNGSTSARAAKAVKKTASEVAEAGSSRKKVVIGVAALAGVAAGVAAIYGRKKLIDASSDALEAVTGGSKESGAPTMSAD